MTNKRMAVINKRRRIIRRILNGDCLYQIAQDERVSHNHVNRMACDENIEHCNHNRPWKHCIPIPPPADPQLALTFTTHRQQNIC